jgi:Fe-S cluster biogenesis protein NfuA
MCAFVRAAPAGEMRDNVDPPEMAEPMELVLKACKEQLVPLVRADGGEIYVVTVTAEDVHLHLAGTCAGCPGATMTRDRLVEPALRAVLPKVQVKVTTGWRVPEGAKKIE